MHRIHITDDVKKAVTYDSDKRLVMGKVEDDRGGQYLITWKSGTWPRRAPGSWTKPIRVRRLEQIGIGDDYDVTELEEGDYIVTEDRAPRRRHRHPGQCCGNCRYFLDERQLAWPTVDLDLVDGGCDKIIMLNRARPAREHEDAEVKVSDWCEYYRQGSPDVLDDRQWGFVPDDEGDA